MQFEQYIEQTEKERKEIIAISNKDISKEGDLEGFYETLTSALNTWQIQKVEVMKHYRDVQKLKDLMDIIEKKLERKKIDVYRKSNKNPF